MGDITCMEITNTLLGNGKMATSKTYKAVARAAKKAGYELVRLNTYSKDDTNIDKLAVWDDGITEEVWWKRNNDRTSVTVCDDGELLFTLWEVGNRQTTGEETKGESRNAAEIFSMVHTPWPASSYDQWGHSTWNGRLDN
jgi:hypothetical protein